MQNQCEMARIVVTEDLIRRANQAAIDGKKFSREIEDAAASRPRLTMDQINEVWAHVNGKKDNR